MRLFLAIDLPEDIQTKLDKKLDAFRKEYPYLSWVSKENFHITLQFLGEVDTIEKIVPKIETAVYDIPSFYLYTSEADLFINNRITMYVTFNREKKLELLADKVREQLEMREDKKFIPHLTFARYRVPSKQQYFLIKKKLASLELDIEFLVNKIYLFESILGGKKPIYEKRAEFMLLSE